jgi:hypothetical protein
MNRTLYLSKDEDDSLWETAQRIAGIKNESMSAAVIRGLRKYVEENRHLLEAVERAEKENRNGS